tara:strand:- start:2499 stop:2873 length:375 start_codon:yes stop_codon:yes gene_type:complete
MTTPTFFIDDTAVAARSAELPNASFTTGMNFGGSCANGVGINVGVANLVGTPDQFTLLDQEGAARTPQTSQHIGGSGLGAGSSGTLPDASVRFAVPTADGSGDVAVTRPNATLVSLATGWAAPV